MAGLYIGNIQSSATDFGKGSQRDLLDSITMVDAKGEEALQPPEYAR